MKTLIGGIKATPAEAIDNSVARSTTTKTNNNNINKIKYMPHAYGSIDRCLVEEIREIGSPLKRK